MFKCLNNSRQDSPLPAFIVVLITFFCILKREVLYYTIYTILYTITYQNRHATFNEFLRQGIFGQNKPLDIRQDYKTNSAFINFSQTPLII